MTKLEQAARQALVALEAATELIECYGSGYGFACTENPHRFCPDAAECSAEEIANHSAACDAYSKGEQLPKGSWGIGSYTGEPPKEISLSITALREALAEPELNLNCKSVQKRLATSWGYVKAEQAECKECGAKQAQIDRLMLEYCPDEMTPEQMKEWGNNQRPVEQAEQEPFDMDDHPPHRLCECRKCMEYFTPLPDCDAFAASGKPIAEQTNTQLMEGYRIGLAEMREKCAKVCETDELCCKCGDECAEAIRARGNHGS